MTEYVPWRDRYAQPVIRTKGWFVAAADQVTRYGRQLADLNTTVWDTEFGYIWEAAWTFLEQFDGSNREVLTRTFWRAYNS